MIFLFMPFGALLSTLLSPLASEPASATNSCLEIYAVKRELGSLSLEAPCHWEEGSYGVVHFISFGSGIDQNAYRDLNNAVMRATDSPSHGWATVMRGIGFEGETSYCLHLGVLDEERRASLIEEVRHIASSGTGVLFSEQMMCADYMNKQVEPRPRPTCRALLQKCFES